MVEIKIAREELLSQEELLVKQYKVTQQTGSRHMRRIRELAHSNHNPKGK